MSEYTVEKRVIDGEVYYVKVYPIAGRVREQITGASEKIPKVDEYEEAADFVDWWS